MRVATELPHFPQAEQTIEQVAAPQQLAPKERSCGYIVSLSHFVDVSWGGDDGGGRVLCLGLEPPSAGGRGGRPSRRLSIAPQATPGGLIQRVKYYVVRCDRYRAQKDIGVRWVYRRGLLTVARR